VNEQEQEPFKALELSDKVMVDLFTRVSEHDGFRPYKAEVEQFFSSRIWTIIESEGTLKLAQLFNMMLKPGITEREIAEVVASIRMMSWWLNLKSNVFAARQRTMEVDAKTPGGDQWQDQF